LISLKQKGAKMPEKLLSPLEEQQGGYHDAKEKRGDAGMTIIF
jgi:hypothetical protein